MINKNIPRDEAPTASIGEDFVPKGNPKANDAPNFEKEEGPSRVALSVNMLNDVTS